MRRQRRIVLFQRHPVLVLTLFIYLFHLNIRSSSLASSKLSITTETKEERRRRIRREQETLIQWQKFLVAWEKKNFNKSSQLKTLCRGGIPEEFRAQVWMHLSGASAYKKENPNVYSEIISSGEQCSDYEYILRDINRTFPSHSMFKDKDSIGQASLLNVLNAYAVFNKKVRDKFEYKESVRILLIIYLNVCRLLLI